MGVHVDGGKGRWVGGGAWQVPLLISMQEDERALMKAIEGGDTDLVFLALLHMKRKKCRRRRRLPLMTTHSLRATSLLYSLVCPAVPSGGRGSRALSRRTAQLPALVRCGCASNRTGQQRKQSIAAANHGSAVGPPMAATRVHVLQPSSASCARLRSTANA